MIGRRLLNSKWTKALSALTSVAAGWKALREGRTERGALFLVAGAVSLRWSGAGVAAQLAAEVLSRR
ncbi:hypothetical protein [Haloferax marisrubri]|uniref:Uncharacterized protein n=1 Tax=Haloferax marisrubri TaxID=1544719 RepID=A0A2P4NKX9_9EURY|nr:hypothetical protein [Haloferax marisrubri]POG53769.1 hypothetical protein AUR65_018515 [Haloferax marisrubri]